MGTSFTNCHVRTTDPQPVQDALTALSIPAFVSDAANGWVSVFPVDDNFDGDDVAASLAERLSLPVLNLWEYDSDVGGYKLFEGVTLRDEYQTDPDYGAGEPGEDGEPIPHKSPEESARLAGNPDVLLAYCVPGTTVEDIRAALGQNHEDSINRVAAYLGRDPADLQAEHRKTVEEAMTRFSPVFASLNSVFGRGDEPRNFSYDDFLAKPDPDSVLPALSKLLGIQDRGFGTRFRDFASGDADFPVTLVGEEHIPQEEKEGYLCEAASSHIFGDHYYRTIQVAVQRWLAAGADPNAVEPYSAQLVLHSAIGRGENAAVVRLLLNAGADASRRDNQGKTPLDIALTLPEDHPRRAEIIEALRAAGATE